MTSDTTIHPEEQAIPELAALDLPDVPDGPGAAAMLSAGIGVFVLGLLTVLSEASTGIHDLMEDFQGSVGVGPLAGKTTLAVVAYFASWALLWALWRKRDIDIRLMFWIGLGLGVAGALGTFPPFFTAFA
jgi:hypothetical protein